MRTLKGTIQNPVKIIVNSEDVKSYTSTINVDGIVEVAVPSKWYMVIDSVIRNGKFEYPDTQVPEAITYFKQELETDLNVVGGTLSTTVFVTIYFNNRAPYLTTVENIRSVFNQDPLCGKYNVGLN